MASLITGYEYDIFISYRQKDNKYDGWVTEFVDNLKKELEATFKDEISVYFDINPHDGLLETHNVDESLKEKLKCLVFIPVISQTYCDPKSFAWQHEFCAFNKMAKEDQFGRDIKLASGNVASRILPVKIHDLDPEDKSLLENELGGDLRGIEFIYKSAGVNRPLRANEDHPHDNLNKTYYRDQINKVANAVKEIIAALKKPSSGDELTEEKVFTAKPAPQRRLNKKTISWSLVILALLVLGYIFIPKLFKTKEPVERSIAVLPFRNLSADTAQAYFCDGIREEILFHLQKIDAFSVRSRTSADHYRNTDKNSAVIGNELNVNYLVEGSIESEGTELRIWVQLIDAMTDEHVWAGNYTKEKIKVFSLQSEIAQRIASELKVILSPQEIEEIDRQPTENVEAYQAYLQGRYYAGQPHFTLSNWYMALENFQKAVDIDTTFGLAYAELARTHARLRYLRQDLSDARLEMADQAAKKALQYDSEEPRVHLALGYYYLFAYRDEKNALEHLEIAEKGMPNDVEILLEKADIVLPQGKWEEAIHLLEKASQANPREVSILTHMTFCLMCTHQYEYGLEVCDRAIALAPNGNWPYIYKVYINFMWKGPGNETREILKHIDPAHEWYNHVCYLQETGEGNFDAALQLLSDSTKVWGVHHKMWTAPQSMLRAFIYDYLGETERARSDYQKAVEILEEKVLEVPDDPRYHSALGIGYAALGEKDKATEEGLKATELLPITEDAVYGITYLQDLAINYIYQGEYDLALDHIEHLLKIPSWITPAWLDMEIRFAPLKSHPRFKELLSEYAKS